MKIHLLLVTFFFVLSNIVSAEPAHYRLTELVGLPGGDTSSTPWDINNKGQVVGESSTANEYYTINHAFLWENGTMKDLGDLPGGDACSGSVAYSVNESGQIVGYGSVSYSYQVPGELFGRLVSNAPMAFIYENNTMRGMDDYSAGKKNTVTTGINNSGEIVGRVYGGEYQYTSSAFLTNANSTVDQGQIFAEPSGTAQSINNSGQIIGNFYDSTQHFSQNQPFIYAESLGINELCLIESVLPNNEILKDGKALAINDNDFVVGYCLVYNENIPIDYQAVVWGTDLQPVLLGHLEGGNSNMACGINIHNQIVGYESSTFSSLPYDCAVLWENGTAYNLNTLIDETGTGWQLLGATAINDNGWIVGYGTNPDGLKSAFLMTPVPEPTALSLLCLGLIALRRKKI